MSDGDDTGMDVPGGDGPPPPPPPPPPPLAASVGHPEWRVAERSTEWFVTDVSLRVATVCRSSRQLKLLALLDNHCNSAVVNHCALNSYWIPEGRGDTFVPVGATAGVVRWSGRPGTVSTSQHGDAAGVAPVLLSQALGAVSAGARVTASGAAQGNAVGAIGLVVIGAANSIVMRGLPGAAVAVGFAGTVDRGFSARGAVGTVVAAGQIGTAPTPAPDLEVAATGAESVDEDAVYTLTYTISGGDAGDVTSIHIDWGDGNSEQA